MNTITSVPSDTLVLLPLFESYAYNSGSLVPMQTSLSMFLNVGSTIVVTGNEALKVAL